MISSNRIRQLKVIQNRVAFLYCIERVDCDEISIFGNE